MIVFFYQRKRKSNTSEKILLLLNFVIPLDDHLRGVARANSVPFSVSMNLLTIR